MRTPLTLFLAAAIACGGGASDSPRRTFKEATDTMYVPPPAPTFTVPDDWETVQLPNGVTFKQPPAFTAVGAARLACDANTPDFDRPVMPTDETMPWPLTLNVRRGQLGKIAYTNGFTLDSTDIAEHHEAAPPKVYRGEGYLLLRGTRLTFGAVRHAAGCYIIWAARGLDINADTLGKVMGTVRSGGTVDPPPP